MARTFGKLLCTIWEDPDFLALSSDAKVLYSAFISQPDITPAGILALTERRWRKYLGGDLNAVSGALDELHERRFVFVDEDTAEVWVKGFIEHDGRLDNDNLAKSVHRSAVEIRSDSLQSHCRERYPDIFPGQRASEGRPKADRDGGRRDVELLEPAASSQQPEPCTDSQQPLPAESASPAAAAEFTDHVIDAIIGIRLQSDRNVRNPTRYRAALKRDLPVEHGERITDLHAEYPTAAASLIAGAIVSGDMRQLASHRRSA